MEQLSTSSGTTTQTTPQKRKHCEYHDPDYNGVSTPEKHAAGAATTTTTTTTNAAKRAKLETSDAVAAPRSATGDEAANRQAAIMEIVQREFQKEIVLKEEQLVEIDARLAQARQMLDKLRYDVVSEYYRKQEVPLTPADVLRVRGSDTLFDDERAGAQRPLHPAVKKIVGKRPAPMQTHVPERTAAALAKQTIRLRNPAHRREERRRQQKIREQGIVIDHSKDQLEQPPPLKVEKEPEDEERPCTSKQALERLQRVDIADVAIPALNASRMNNKNKFNFVVGNTSKYIGGELAGDEARSGNGQALAYKWLVYVQGKNLPQPVGAYLKKVRFQLHHSYRPNDIVDVHAPPFQLTRRGWGEFPMRIHLYFQEQLQQKPVQLMHTVVLDKTMCGLHTMGAETIVEVWLRADANANASTTAAPAPPPIASKSECFSPLPTPLLRAMTPPLLDNDHSKPRTISITHNKEELDDSLFGCLNKCEMSGDIDRIEPTVLMSEPLTCKLKLSSPKKEPPMTSSKPQLRLNAAPVSASRAAIVYLPVNGNANGNSNGNSLPRHKPAQLNGHGAKPPPKHVVFQKAGKLYIIDPLQSKLKQAQKQQSLLKPQLSLLKPPPLPPSTMTTTTTTPQLAKHWQTLLSIHNDHGYAMSQDCAPSAQPLSRRSSEELPPPPSQRQRLEQLLDRTQFQSMRSAVEFLLRRLPLIADGTASSDFVHVSRSLAAFQAAPALRQRCFEYLRARTLLRLMRQQLKLQQLQAAGPDREHFWSIREIVGFARLHGYTPPLKLFQRPAVVKREQAEPELAQRVQQQLKEEPPEQLTAYASLSSSTHLTAWLARQEKRLQSQEQQLEDQQSVDVVALDEPRPASRPSTSNGSRNSRQLYLPAPTQLEAAAQLVRDMCKDVGITLQPEQSVAGVSQPLALTVLAHVIQLFVEKLVRRSVAAKLQLQQQQRAGTQAAAAGADTLALTAANVELTLLPCDIGRVLAQCAELDFLGNSNLGVAPVDSQS